MNYGTYLEFLEKYEEQKKLEKYQRERILPRPNTTKRHVALWGIFFLIILIGIVFAMIFLPLRLAIRLPAGIVCLILLADGALRVLGIKVVECYQHYASEERRRKCLCVPSCSEYAIACFRKYFFLKAILKIRIRLFKTCQGDDYKTDLP